MAEETALANEQLQIHLANQDKEALDAFLWGLPFEDRARLINRLEAPQREALMTQLSPEDAAALLEELAEEQARLLFMAVPAEQAAQIADEIHSNVRADIIGGMDAKSTDAILRFMEPEEAKDLRELISYAADTAGGLMITEFLSYRDTMTVGDILDDLRTHGEEYADYDVQYAYIEDEAGKLVGVLRMRDLLFAQKSRKASAVMIKNPVSVNATDPLDRLIRFFDDHGFFGVPVVGDSDELCGVLRRSDVGKAAAARANSIFLRVSGIIGGEELRDMPLKTRFSRRLSFLSINIFLNIIAASVIAMKMDVLDQVIALAVFMPIISDMSGCSGNQAVAVSIRELALGLVKPKEFFRVFKKEAAVGVINGICLGVLLGIVAYLWKGNIWLGAVAAVALCINTLVAVCFGGLIPLLLKGMRLDPALVSGPVLTTVTDMCGFFLVLTLAGFVLEKLV
ncbi:MAG: magnesium transporter [Sumerlaeia bacterium]